MPRLLAFCLFATHVSCGLLSTVAQDRIVELEITIVGIQSADHQEWANLLSDVGADSVRMRSGAASARPDLSEEEIAGRTHVLLKGVLRSGKIELPGGSFTKNQVGDIKALIQRFRADGAKVTLAEKMAFGLTAEQLVEVNERLAPELTFSTQGETSRDVVDRIGKTIQIGLTIDRRAQAALASGDLVSEELQGMSAGTALAAVLRPLGLVAVPERPQGAKTVLRIVDSQQATEFWPVGWPLQEAPLQAVPALYETLDVRINDTTLLEAIRAIEQRTHIKVLLDHNSLARGRVDLEQTRVSFNKPRQTYYAILRELLSQSRPKLKLEVRSDEALKPFIWISTQ